MRALAEIAVLLALGDLAQCGFAEADARIWLQRVRDGKFVTGEPLTGAHSVFIPSADVQWCFRIGRPCKGLPYLAPQ